MDQKIKESKLRKMQLQQVEMLNEVVRICKKYNLTYYLYYGTLLGAVRHKGFIPWDDDMDIVMSRKDYNLFCKIAPEELAADFFFQDECTDNNYPCAIARIRKNGTVYKEPFMSRQNFKHYGCWIDIYPLDNVSGQCSLVFLFQVVINKAVIDRLTNYRALNDLKGLPIVKVVLHYFSFVLPLSRWIRIRNAIYQFNKNDKSKYCINFTSPYSSKKDLMPREAFYPPVQIEFEGRFYNAPNHWNCILKQIYGDYMELPPENKRIGHMPLEWKV